MRTTDRDEIFGEADTLRDRLGQIEALAESVIQGECERATSLRMLGLELVDLLAGRIALEKWELLPALRASRLPGVALQARRLDRAHRYDEQQLREQLDALADASRPARAVASSLLRLARETRDGLEGATHLAPDTLPLGEEVFIEVETCIPGCADPLPAPTRITRSCA